MPYQVLIKRKAQRQLDKILREDRERITEPCSDSATTRDREGARDCKVVPDIASGSATTERSTS